MDFLRIRKSFRGQLLCFVSISLEKILKNLEYELQFCRTPLIHIACPLSLSISKMRLQRWFYQQQGVLSAGR